MRIKALTTFAVAYQGFAVGREYDIDDLQAKQFIADGLVGIVAAEPEVVVEPAPTVQDKAKRAKRARNDSSSND